MKFLSDNDRLIACRNNLISWPWDLYPEFKLEREDIEVVLPILKKHLFNRTSPDKNNPYWSLHDRLVEVIADPHTPSYKAIQSEGELLQVVLGDFL